MLFIIYQTAIGWWTMSVRCPNCHPTAQNTLQKTILTHSVLYHYLVLRHIIQGHRKLGHWKPINWVVFQPWQTFSTSPKQWFISHSYKTYSLQRHRKFGHRKPINWVMVQPLQTHSTSTSKLCIIILTKPYLLTPEARGLVKKLAGFECVFTYSVRHSFLAHPSRTKW